MVSVIAVVAMFLLGLAGLWLSIAARRNRAFYDAQVRQFASTGIVSPDYARGLISVSWIIGLGLSIVAASSLWTAMQGNHRANPLTIWVLVAGVVLIDAGLACAWFMRPKWAIPAHARDDPSPVDQRRARRQARKITTDNLPPSRPRRG